MGLFGGLFDKKRCSVCGGDIGLLGNRKLEDGNLCKDCAAKLSPWFNERRHATVAEIADQLEYRAANYERANAFNVTVAYGNGFKKLLVDADKGEFAITNAKHPADVNADILSFGQIAACLPEVREHRSEVMHRTQDGRMVPLHTRRFHYTYDFAIKLQVRHPFFDDMAFELNPHDIEGDDRENCRYYETLTEDVVELLTGMRPILDGQTRWEPPFCMECGHELLPSGRCPMCSCAAAPMPGARMAPPPPEAGRMAPPPPPPAGRMAPPAPAPHPGVPSMKPNQAAYHAEPKPGPAPHAPAGRPGPAPHAPAGHPGSAASAPAGRPGPIASAPAGRPGPAASAPAGRPGPAASAPAGRPGPAASAPAGRPGPAASAPAGRPGPAASAPAGRPDPALHAPAGRPNPATEPKSGPAPASRAGAMPAPGSRPAGPGDRPIMPNHGPKGPRG